MNVLLMGGSVFLGRALMERLRETGARVFAVTRGLVPNDWSGVEHLRADRRSASDLRRVLSGKRFDAIVDASCYTAQDCNTLLDALENPAPIHVLISSAAVYKRQLVHLPFSESDAVGGDAIWGAYGIDKYQAEQALLTAPTRAKHIHVLRPPYLYGPRNNLPREQFVWARLIAGQAICVPDNGQTLLQFCHVDDLARVVLMACSGRLPGGVYNVGEPSVLTATQWIQTLASVAGKTATLRHVVNAEIPAREYFPFRAADLTLNTRRLAQAADICLRPFDLGATQTYEWFKQNTGFDVPLSATEQRLLTANSSD